MEKRSKIIYWGLVFFVGCFLGWIYEECFSIIIEHQLVNRGFFYGCYLPVYGSGSVILLLLLRNLKKYPILIFLLSIIITGIVEYVTGDVLFRIYHRTWWDYTGLFMNLNGYVCLRSVLNFAVLTLLFMYIVEPLLKKFITKKERMATIITISIAIIFSIDMIITFTTRY